MEKILSFGDNLPQVILANLTRVGSFKLTDQSYEKLKRDGLPGDTLKQLYSKLNNKAFIGKKDFLDAVNKAIGSEQAVKYKTAINKSAMRTSLEEVSNPLKKYLKKFGVKNQNVRNREVQIQYHHKLLARILKKRGIVYIAMQYPTLSIDKIQQYFTDGDKELSEDFKDVLFVENLNNFSKVLNENSYDDIFTDHFKGSWGHTTQFGHQLIAENILPVILKTKPFKK